MSCSDVSLKIHRGWKKTVRFISTDRNGDRVDLSSSVLVFYAWWDGGSLTKSTTDAEGFTISGDEVGLAIMVFSEDESAGLPLAPIRFKVYREQDTGPALLGEGSISTSGA